ncbi:hypothetical protein B7P43_G08107 [Cryptotermes secundus]|uniref:Ribosomal protein eL8/eL30/eS12/Gadd45 domain-containing protein n=1 Tax=Cryptotermes secundus TaxID=105785 RepID=A0A2J7Q653_9NEOP|nr:hypothetical protein B7P43_G08107 [Cryptotermes secundus]
MLKEIRANQVKADADRVRMENRMDANMRSYQEMEANRRKDKEDFLAKLESNQEKANIMLAKLYADRNTDKDDMLKEMKAMQENRKTDKEDLMTKLDANQEKAAADKEELKAAMQSIRTELDDQIQHRVENILAIVEHDKQTLRSAIPEQIEVSLCARTDKLQENLTKNYNETCAAIDETKREFQARAVMTVLRKAQSEKRLTCGLLPAIKLLEMDPGSALFCIMPESSQGNAALHIQTVLLQAFCYENDIHIIQVDSAGKLGDIVTGTHDGPRLDSSCVIVHQPWATDQPVLSKSEQQLVRFCHKTLDEFPQPVIKLPGL